MNKIASEALSLAAETFQKYAELHAAKNTPEGDEKAASNRLLSEKMTVAIMSEAWNNPKLVLPPPFTEVVIKVEGRRNPMWRNTYCLVVYRNEKGEWFEERHPSEEPIVGVIGWKEISY